MSSCHALLHLHNKFMEARRNAKKKLKQDLRKRTERHARAHIARMHAYKKLSLQKFKRTLALHAVSHEKLLKASPATKKKIIKIEDDVIRLEQQLKKMLEKPGGLATTNGENVLVRAHGLKLLAKIGKKNKELARLISARK